MKLSSSLVLAGATLVGAFAPKAFVGRAKTAVNVAVGDSLPAVELFQGFPGPKKINLADYAKGKNLIVVGLPGAFTPTVPGYLEAQGDLKAAGIDEVLVYCVNDPAVMQAWGYDQKIGGSMINFMADPIGELTAALDMKMTSPGPPSIGLVNRCKRFAMHVVDGEVKYFAVSESENDPAGDDDPTTSSAPAMLDAVKAAV